MPSIKTSAQLKNAIAGYMQRLPSVFVRGTVPDQIDLLLVAMNNARLYAERLIDFELSKSTVDFPETTLTEGTELENAVLHGTTTPAEVKKVTVPYLPLADGTYYPVDLWTKRTWSDRIKRRFESAKPTDSSDFAQITEVPFTVIQHGTTLFVVPADTTAVQSPFTLSADCFLWLPDYVDGTETDFLINHCFDWMMFYSVHQLNFYLKEDERVALAQSVLNDTWAAVVRWNDELHKANTDDVDLD